RPRAELRGGALTAPGRHRPTSFALRLRAAMIAVFVALQVVALGAFAQPRPPAGAPPGRAQPARPPRPHGPAKPPPVAAPPAPAALPPEPAAPPEVTLPPTEAELARGQPIAKVVLAG